MWVLATGEDDELTTSPEEATFKSSGSWKSIMKTKIARQREKRRTILVRQGFTIRGMAEAGTDEEYCTMRSESVRAASSLLYYCNEERREIMS